MHDRSCSAHQTWGLKLVCDRPPAWCRFSTMWHSDSRKHCNALHWRYQDYRGSHYQQSCSSDPCSKIQFETKVKSLIFLSENCRYPLQFETKARFETKVKSIKVKNFQKMAAIRSILFSVALVSLASQVAFNLRESCQPCSLTQTIWENLIYSKE